MILVQDVPVQNNLNAKDVTVDFISKLKLVHLVLVLVQHVKMIRFVILVKKVILCLNKYAGVIVQIIIMMIKEYVKFVHMKIAINV